LNVGTDVAVHRCESGSEQNGADDDENYRIGVAEIKVAAAHLLEEEEDADGDDHRGTKQGADLASRAMASWIVAHRNSSLPVVPRITATAEAAFLADVFVAIKATIHKTFSKTAIYKLCYAARVHFVASCCATSAA
jgi:hypothetical protein